MCQSSDGQTVRRSDGRRVGRGRGHLTVRPSDRPSVLLQDLRHHAGAHRPPTLADREAQPLVHRDRRDQLDRHLDVVPRHHHLHPRRQLHPPQQQPHVVPRLPVIQQLAEHLHPCHHRLLRAVEPHHRHFLPHLHPPPPPPPPLHPPPPPSPQHRPHPPPDPL